MVTRHEINTVHSATDKDTVRKKTFQPDYTIFTAIQAFNMTDGQMKNKIILNGGVL